MSLAVFSSIILLQTFLLSADITVWIFQCVIDHLKIHQMVLWLSGLDPLMPHPVWLMISGFLFLHRGGFKALGISLMWDLHSGLRNKCRFRCLMCLMRSSLLTFFFHYWPALSCKNNMSPVVVLSDTRWQSCLYECLTVTSDSFLECASLQGVIFQFHNIERLSHEVF